MDKIMDDQISPNPILEILVGVLILIIIIIVHGMGMRLVNRHFSAAWAQLTPATPHWRADTLLAIAIGSLAVVHLIETFLWAVPLYLMDIIPRMRDCYYYVLESYTTLGEGNVVLPDRWRLIGPIIAMSGLFTFGWTASVLVSIMTEFGKLDRARAKKSFE
jgi:hypothetical protein